MEPKMLHMLLVVDWLGDPVLADYKAPEEEDDFDEVEMGVRDAHEQMAVLGQKRDPGPWVFSGSWDGDSADSTAAPELMNDSEILILEWVSSIIDDEESILCDEGGERAEATCGGYLLVARSWAVSGEASWHVEAGFDETPDQPAGAGGDISAASLLAAQLAAEAYVMGRLAVDPGVAAAVAARVAEVERDALRAQVADAAASEHEFRAIARSLGLGPSATACEIAETVADRLASIAEIEALLWRLGCPGPEDATLAQRVTAVINWSRKLRDGEWLPATAMSYGIDPDALAAHDAAAAARARLAELEALINTPRTADWLEAVRLEAAHQIERWGTSHDAGKAPPDWFWLLGYLGGKALTAQLAGNTDKALHHAISTGAALLNWHRAITGESTAMRPGIAPPNGVQP